MAGVDPTVRNQSVQLNMLNQLAASDPEPVSKTLLAIGGKILGALFAAHAKKVREEASTLDGAFPAWRQEVIAVVDAYNSGQVDAAGAASYIDQGRNLWYQQVSGIMRGKPNGGVSPDEYYQMHPRFAPIDPCNGACYLSYYYIEPEAQILKVALAQGGTSTVELEAVVIRNGDSQPALTLQLSPSVLAGVESRLPDAFKKNPLIFGALALLVAVVAIRAVR